MTSINTANILQFFWPEAPSENGVAPQGASLNDLRKPWSIRDIHEAGETAPMRLSTNSNRKLLAPLWAQLDDRHWLEKIESRHRTEFHERRLGAPLSDFISRSPMAMSMKFARSLLMSQPRLSTMPSSWRRSRATGI